MLIRKALGTDLNDALSVEKQAFGGETEAELVRALLNDPTAQPSLSLLAYKETRAIGHILFTAVHLADDTGKTPAYILAPLAVVPDMQKQGVGGKLVKRGLELLSESKTGLVFVLGHPEYYPRFGFQPAGRLGFEAPYPIPEKHAGAWMVRELCPGIIRSVQGRIVCARAMDKPEYWRE